MALRDAALDLAEHRAGAPAARASADERNDAERARERAAVLDLHERAHPLEPGVGLHAADRADVPRDRGRRLLARPRDDRHVRAEPSNAPSRFAPHPVT